MLCIGCLTMANAQTFTQRVQQNTRAGEGKVTITQDKAIDDLVNGQKAEDKAVAKPAATKPTAANKPADNKTGDKTGGQKSESEKAREQLASILEMDGDTATAPIIIDNRRKVMRGVKVDGYRVQAFAGGNQRKDRQKAEQVGNTIKNNFPDEPIYVHFYSPRWICRVGNYRTYEEAHQMLLNIRKLGISGASIVKGKITVQY